MKFKIYFKLLLYLIIACFTFFIIRLLIIFPWTPQILSYSNPLESSELIVCLDGEYYERVNHAFDLAERDFAKMIFAPSVGYSKSKELINKRLKENKYFIQFIKGKGASSTYEEAIETKRFIKENNISSFILVTSPYHSYRAQWIFKKIIPKARIISSPVNKNKTENQRKLIKYFRSEQRKFLVYYLLYGFRVSFR